MINDYTQLGFSLLILITVWTLVAVVIVIIIAALCKLMGEVESYFTDRKKTRESRKVNRVTINEGPGGIEYIELDSIRHSIRLYPTKVYDRRPLIAGKSYTPMDVKQVHGHRWSGDVLEIR